MHVGLRVCTHVYESSDHDMSKMIKQQQQKQILYVVLLRCTGKYSRFWEKLKNGKWIQIDENRTEEVYI